MTEARVELRVIAKLEADFDKHQHLLAGRELTRRQRPQHHPPERRGSDRPMTAVPSYRELAQRTLGQAAQDLNAMPQGNVASAEITARAAKAQAIATVAAAQALLEIGDVLREHLQRGDA